MGANYYKKSLLATTSLPILSVMLIASSQNAYADCSVTAGGGSVSNPNDGATVGCYVAGGDQTTTIGNGTDGVSVNVNIEAGATVNVAANAIEIDDVIVTLGAGARLETTVSGNRVLNAYSNPDNLSQNITLYDNAQIYSQDNNASAIRAESINGTTTQNATLSGNGAQIQTQGSYADAFFARSENNTASQTITLSGDNSRIQTQGQQAEGARSTSRYGAAIQNITLSGNGAQIQTQGQGAEGVFTFGRGGTANQTVTLSGDGALIQTVGDSAEGVYSYSRFGTATQTLTLSGDGAQIEAQGKSTAVRVHSVNGTASQSVTLSSNTSIVSQLAEATRVFGGGGGNPNSTIDSAGLIQGGTNSIILDDGNDSLILRTGSNLSSPIGVDMGAGTDTLTLVGDGNEDEVFLNTEIVEVNANTTGWELTSTSAFDDFNINTGFFSNNGILTINNLLTVNDGATFGGSGNSIGNVLNNGIISPGNSVGTQIITGNFVQGAGGILNIEFDSTGTDFLDISGTASLNGTLTLSEYAAGVSFGTPYTFLEADAGISGNFATIPTIVATSSGLANVQVDIGATAATLTLNAGSGLDDNSTTTNQTSISSALNNPDPVDTATAVQIANTLNNDTDTSGALSSQSGSVVLNAVGSVNTSIAQVNNVVQSKAANLNNNSSTLSSTSTSDIASLQPAAGGVNKHFWGQAFGGVGEIDSDNTSLGTDYNTYGFAAGVDKELDNTDASLGLFVAFTSTNSDTKEIADESVVKSYQAGLYGTKHLQDDLYINGSVSGAYLAFDTKRPTALGTALAEFEGAAAFAYGEAVYNAFKTDNAIFSPYLGFESSTIYHGDYTESGAGILNMGLESETSLMLSSEIGGQYEAQYNIENYTIKPKFKLGWSHQFLDNSSEATSRFVSAPSVTFNSAGPELERDSAKIGFELNAKNHNEDTEFYTKYDGSVASDAKDHLFTIGFRIKL